MKKHENIVFAKSEIHMNPPIDDVCQVLAEELAQIAKQSSKIRLSFNNLSR